MRRVATVIGVLVVLAGACAKEHDPAPSPAPTTTLSAVDAPAARAQPGPADAAAVAAAKVDAAPAAPPAADAAPPAKAAPPAGPRPRPTPAKSPPEKPAPAPEKPIETPKAEPPPAPPPSTAGAVTPEIKALWSKKCAGCHGPTGKAAGAMGQKMAIDSMATPDWQKRFSDDELKKATTQGLEREESGVKQKMPGYKLTPAELDGLVALMRSFG